MRLSAPLIVLAAALAAPSARAQPAVAARPLPEATEAGVLVGRAAPDLAFHLDGLARAEVRDAPAAPAAGPRRRGAARGAKVGLLVGVATGVAAYGFLRLRDRPCDFVCEWDVAAVLALPLTALTAASGAVIGAATARPDPPVAPTTGP
jgi:hypothetical protein